MSLPKQLGTAVLARCLFLQEARRFLTGKPSASDASSSEGFWVPVHSPWRSASSISSCKPCKPPARGSVEHVQTGHTRCSNEEEGVNESRILLRLAINERKRRV